MRKALAFLLPGLLIAGLRLTIVVDNYAARKDVKAAWGFSVLVKRDSTLLLFDTGPSPEILSFNMKSLGIHPDRVKYIFLSHRHSDHTGGMDAVLRPGQKVFVLEDFPLFLIEKIKRKGAIPVYVKKDGEILPEFYSSGPMGKKIKEQSLFIKIDEGIVILTGCSHPGIVKITEIGKKYGPPILVLGGFHLIQTPDWKIREIAKKLKSMEVIFVAPSHCSGEGARNIFSQIFGKKSIKTGAGFVLNIKEGNIK